MNKVERVRAALRGADVDRVPVSSWGHDFLREWSAESTAAAMLDAHRQYDWDYMKVNPRATYYAEAWGCTYRASGDATRGPETVDFVLKSVSDLGKIGPQDGRSGPFAEQLQALRLIGEGLRGEALFIQTVFSPLAVVARLANSDLAAVRGYMEEAPQALHGALRAVAGTLAGYATACLEAGAGGIFFATVDWATYDNATLEQYDEFARPYDLQVLAAVQGAGFNVLHVCRPNNMLERLLNYPVHAFNWASSQAGNLSLADSLTKTDKAVMGGVSERTTLMEGTPADVAAEVRGALAQTGGRRLLVAPGCSVAPQAPEANLRALAEAARGA